MIPLSVTGLFSASLTLSNQLLTSLVDPPGQAIPQRTPVLLGIDIRHISSHAQTEEFVTRAQQGVLEMPLTVAGAGGGASTDDPASVGAVGTVVPAEVTLLSARLAACGESLEIERLLKIEEQRKARAERTPPTRTNRRTPTSASRKTHIPGEVERTFSADQAQTRIGERPRRIRRPHTTEDKTEGVYDVSLCG